MLTLAVALFVSAFLAACGFFFGPSINSMFISPPSAMVATSDTAQLAAFGQYSDGSQSELTGDKVSWSSSDPTVATVTSPGGLVTGVSVGTATITAMTTSTLPASGCQVVVSGNGLSKSCPSASTQTVTATANVSVTASNANNAVITTTQGSTASQTTAQISEAPATLQFFAYANGDDSNDVTQVVIWTSSNPSVATISSGLSNGNGLATGVAAGTTNITASTTNGSTGQVVNSQTIVLTVQ